MCPDMRDVSEKGGMQSVHHALALILKRKVNTYTYLLVFSKKNENEPKSNKKKLSTEERT